MMLDCDYAVVVVHSKTHGDVPFKVDAEDVSLFRRHSWHVSKMGGHFYLVRKTSRKDPGGQRDIRFHREIMDAPSYVLVDHANGDTQDNRRCNLRFADRKENRRNSKTPNKASNLPKGVVRCPRKRGYAAVIYESRRKPVYLGRFSCPVEAGKAYDAAALTLFGEFARLNFPAPLEVG